MKKITTIVFTWAKPNKLNEVISTYRDLASMINKSKGNIYYKFYTTKSELEKIICIATWENEYYYIKHRNIPTIYELSSKLEKISICRELILLEEVK